MLRKIQAISIYLLFFLLVLKNPYSSRNLIGNLEPFPDTQHYITAPLCFIKTGEWKLCRLYNPEIVGSRPSVPPLYSVTLLPFLIINNDPRTFYFANLGLALVALIFFRKIISQLFKNQLITDISSFALVTNYYFYWLTTLAMAENLVLPLFMIGVYLLISKLSIKKAMAAGLIAVSFYGSKYALTPLTITYGLAYSIKIIFELHKDKVGLFKHGLAFLTSGAALSPLVFNFSQLFTFSGELTRSKASTMSRSFSPSFFPKHFPEYSKPLLGMSQRFLWDYTPLLASWIAKLSIVGLIFSVVQKKQRFIGWFLVSSIVTQLLFISTFYVVDARYVYTFFPSLLIGFAFFLNLIFKIKRKNLLVFILLIGAIFYLIPTAPKLKHQIGLNYKYTETPWWKVSVDETNIFFKERNNNYLITLASPYFLDYYSNQNYQPLPLNNQQDFNWYANQTWGENNYSNLIELYKTKMQNHNVYVTNYGTNATSYFEESFKNIEQNFNLVLVHVGCHNLCNLYQLTSLETTQSHPAK